MRKTAKGFVVKILWNENEDRLRALWRLVVLLLLWLTATIILLLLASVVASTLFNYSVDDSVSFELVIGFVGTLLAVWLTGWGLDRRPFTDFGLRINKTWWIDFGFGLFLGGFLIALVFLIEFAAGWVKITETFVTSAPDTNFSLAFTSSIGIFILVSIQEELLFRGYIFTNLAEGFNWQRIGPRWAMIIATLLTASIFSLMHLGNNHASLNSTISVFLGGIILTLGYLLTGELALSIGFHTTWNAFQNSVFGFPVSGEMVSTAALLRIRQAGPTMWVGDAFGLESGLLAIGAVLLGCLLILLWVRLRCGRVRLSTSIAMAKNSA
jgi:membrane protease YdiL (CAAX protease family)